MKKMKYFFCMIMGLILLWEGSLDADVTQYKIKPTVKPKKKLQKMSPVQVKKLFDSIKPPEKKSGTSGLAAVNVEQGSRKIWAVAMNDGIGKSDVAWGGFSTAGFELDPGITIINVRVQIIVEVHEVVRGAQFRLETGPDQIPLDIQNKIISSPGTYTLTSKVFNMESGHIYGALCYLSVGSPPLNKTSSVSATIKGINWLF